MYTLLLNHYNRMILSFSKIFNDRTIADSLWASSRQVHRTAHNQILIITAFTNRIKYDMFYMGIVDVKRQTNYGKENLIETFYRPKQR